MVEAGLTEIGEVARPAPWYRRNAPYTSIYGHDARIEFLLAIGARRYLVETKRMSVSGSVDEKLPFVWLNALENQPEYDFVLVLDGEGWKPEARRWVEAKARADERFTVLGVEGFKIWLSAQLRASAGD
ncbi:PD-(D/E)XK nuclease superfamily protein [Afifella pfennigii]|uniref:PD-(D/E)XK nuclease superfamily protein n=1 Tax=Afifella pfennigii TaxID=209897 RepID=UPI000AB50A89|nr:PD-(D/E)XK nuclease superfamily protein [Afifella pfennigii]